MAKQTNSEKKSQSGKRKPVSTTRGSVDPGQEKKLAGATADSNVAVQRDPDIPIVGVGASAGGLEIESGHIYLSPPEKFVSMAKGKFRPTPPKVSGRKSFLPIDHFFNSLAAAHREKAVCIVLSGSASDGTQGLRAVKAAGGLTFVQSLDDAKYASMPDSAIATQMVDFILPADHHAMNHLYTPAGHDIFKITAREKETPPLPEAYSHAERIILEEYAPPGVLIDRNFGKRSHGTTSAVLPGT